MKKRFKAIYIPLLTIITAIVFSVIPGSAQAAQTTQTAGAQSDGSLILSVEAFTVGCGFIRQPFKVEYSAGDTLFDVIEKGVGKTRMNFNQDLGRSLISFPVDSAWTQITADIRDRLDSEEIPYKNNISQMNWLSNDDFVNGSKWFVTVNNVALKTAVDEQTPVENSVVRVQFSIFGNGADLNQAAGAFVTPQAGTTPPTVIFPVVNRDELYKAMVEYTEDNILDINDTIMEVVTDLNTAQADINKALDDLKKEIETIDPKDFEEVEDDEAGLDEDTDSDNDNDNSNNIPIETDPPVTQPSAVTTTSTLPYIPDDGNGSGNLAKEDSAPTGVNISVPIVLMVASATVTVLLRKRK